MQPHDRPLLWTDPRRECYSFLIWRLSARRVGCHRTSSVSRSTKEATLPESCLCFSKDLFTQVEKGLKMPDYDLRLDVPFRAFVNAKLIWLVQQGGTLWEAKKHLLPQFNLSDEQVYGYHLYDPAMALSLL
jgi:hypothetical protein